MDREDLRTAAIEVELVLLGYPAGWAHRFAACGTTRPEVEESDRAGIHPSSYIEARRAGATHTEILEAHREGDLRVYARARRNGYGHAEILEAFRVVREESGWVDPVLPGWEVHEAALHHIPPSVYSPARRAGFGHTELLEINLGENTMVYAAARKAGLGHDELVRVRKTWSPWFNGVDLWNYTQARIVGATEEEISEVFRAGCSLYRYTEARRAGMSHDEAVNADRERSGNGPV